MKNKNIAVLTLVAMALFAFNGITLAADPDLNQTINGTGLGVTIVDGDGQDVVGPSYSFTAVNFSAVNQTAVGNLGTATSKIRFSNGGAASAFTVSIAPALATAVWDDAAGHTYDFNDNGANATDSAVLADADAVGGGLTINPSAGASSLAGVGGCATVNVSKGASQAFVEGTTDSVTLISATAGSADHCAWDYYGASLSQTVPAIQYPAAYTLSMVMTIA